MEKPPERSAFPCLSPLYYETHEIFPRRISACIHVHVRTHTRKGRVTHGPPHGPACRTILTATLLQRRLFCHGVKYLMARRVLKKGSGGVNASVGEGTSGVISRSSKKLYFMIAATFKLLTMRCVRSRTIIPCILSRDYKCLGSPFYRRLCRASRPYHFKFIDLANFDKLDTFYSVVTEEFFIFFSLFTRIDFFSFLRKLNNFPMIRQTVVLSRMKR